MTAPIAHGGGLIAARARVPGAPEPWIDLSTGINPVAYPVPSMPHAAWTRLPEPEEVAGLEAVAAAAYGVADPACVVAGPGTQALIQWLPHLLPSTRVAVLSPTYAEHAAAWAGAGHVVAESAEVPEDVPVVIAVRPNNPDGALAPADALLRVLGRGGMVVVDEAFADLEGCSLAPLLPRPGLVLLRSFGKTYGLAGARLGFALAEPAMAASLRRALGPWAVSGPAIHAGLHALRDAAWRADAARWLAAEAAHMDLVIRAAGGHVVGGTLLFRLAAFTGAAALADRLERAGILLRRFADRPELLRFGLPPPGSWGRVEAALSGSLGSAP